MQINPNVMIIVQGVFDVQSYTPSMVQLILYYLKHDPSLYDLVGRHFNIPDPVTIHYQVHNLTGIQSLPI